MYLIFPHFEYLVHKSAHCVRGTFEAWSGSEDTWPSMLVRSRQEPHMATVLILALHTLQGLRRSGPGAPMQWALLCTTVFSFTFKKEKIKKH